MTVTAPKKMAKPIVIGRFGKVFGVQGWLRVQSYTKPKENILKYQPWCISEEQALEITAHRFHSGDLLVHIAGIDSPEAAKAQLTGKEVVITRGQLPELDSSEYYWTDLEGIEVITTEGKSLGHIDYLVESGSNDVLVLKGERKRLVPYIKEQVVKQIDLEKGQMIVDWDPEF